MFRSKPTTPPQPISLAPRGTPLLKTLAMVLLGGVLAASWRRFAETHDRRLTTRHAVKPEPLQTWEGEGGQSAYPHVDPDTAARLTESH